MDNDSHPDRTERLIRTLIAATVVMALSLIHI